MKNAKVKAFVAEDSSEVRKRLVAMLATVPGVNVVGEADSVPTAADGVLATGADVLLLDLQLLDGSGLEVLAQIRPVRPALRVIVLSNLATAQYRAASLAAGADVFLDKSHEFGRVPEILRGWLAAPEAAPVR
jgi:DNA-binding NarL/FixJ family response regulator